jgi:Ca2+-transporting ATPase
MEKAMLEHCERHGLSKEQLFDGKLVYEYAFTNELKMMGHVWDRNDRLVIAAKGSPERILTLCDLSDTDSENVSQKLEELSKEGLRVIAVAAA